MLIFAGFLRFLSICIVLLLITLITLPAYSAACPVCYGAPDSPMVAGMNMAILVLLGITGTVLALFVSFFYYLKKRASQ